MKHAPTAALGRHDLLLGALFFSQGLPMGLAWLGLPAWLRGHGADLASIGLVGLTFLPWALKFLWAPPVERLAIRYGCRRVIALTQLLSALAYVLLSLADLQQGLTQGLLWLTLLNALCATQDVATDRHAIRRRGTVGAVRVNTARFVGFTAGMLAGGSGLLLGEASLGWSAFMLLCALWMGGGALLARGVADDEDETSRHQRVRLGDFLQRPHPWSLLCLALFFKAGSAASESMLKAFWVDQGLTLAQVGLAGAVNTSLMGLLGAPLGAWLLSRPGMAPRRVAVAFGLLAAGCLAALALVMPAADSLPREGALPPLYLLLPALQAMADGVASMAFFSVFVRAAIGKQPGTDFTLLLCAESLGGMVLAGLAGLLATRLGYAGHFLLVAGATAIFMAWAWGALERVGRQGQAEAREGAGHAVA